jgi:hypothetical protein
METVDIFGRVLMTGEEYDAYILSGEFKKEKAVGDPVPYIDFGKVAKNTAAFNEFALPRMVGWVKEVSQKPRSTPLHWRDVDHAIACEQKNFSKERGTPDPWIGSFDERSLLKEIMAGKCGPVECVPLDLIGILYIDNILSWNTSTVVCANLDDEAGNNLFFQYKHDDDKNVLSYRIRNFKQPHIAHVEFISQSLQ